MSVRFLHRHTCQTTGNPTQKKKQIRSSKALRGKNWSKSPFLNWNPDCRLGYQPRWWLFICARRSELIKNKNFNKTCLNFFFAIVKSNEIDISWKPRMCFKNVSNFDENQVLYQSVFYSNRPLRICYINWNFVCPIYPKNIFWVETYSIFYRVFIFP